jgi:hypothetical protein
MDRCDLHIILYFLLCKSADVSEHITKHGKRKTLQITDELYTEIFDTFTIFTTQIYALPCSLFLNYLTLTDVLILRLSHIQFLSHPVDTLSSDRHTFTITRWAKTCNLHTEGTEKICSEDKIVTHSFFWLQNLLCPHFLLCSWGGGGGSKEKIGCFLIIHCSSIAFTSLLFHSFDFM